MTKAMKKGGKKKDQMKEDKSLVKSTPDTQKKKVSSKWKKKSSIAAGTRLAPLVLGQKIAKNKIQHEKSLHRYGETLLIFCAQDFFKSPHSQSFLDNQLRSKRRIHEQQQQLLQYHQNQKSCDAANDLNPEEGEKVVIMTDQSHLKTQAWDDLLVQRLNQLNETAATFS